jgi:hypothetical protein
MSATNLATAHEIYSKRVLKKLQRALAALQAFSTSLSDELADIGETIKIPLISPDAVAPWDAATNNFVRSAAELKEVSLKIVDRIICGFQITGTQMSNFRPSWWEGKADLNVEEIADKILSAVAALVTPENFGDEAGDKTAVALAKFGPSSIADVRAFAVKRQMKVARSVLALNPDFFSALLGKLDANVYGGRESIVGGTIPGLLGFRAIVELPQLAGPGFLCHPDAIAVGTRKIPLADTSPYKLVRDITEPETGLTMTNVVLVHGPDGSLNDSINASYVTGVGNEDALVRLVA